MLGEISKIEQLGQRCIHRKEVRTDKAGFTANTDSRNCSRLQSANTPNPVFKHYDITTDEYHRYRVEYEAADNIIRQECSLEEAHPLAKIKEIQHTALLLFAGYLDAATSMAASSGEWF